MEHKTPEHLRVSTEYLRRNLPAMMSQVEGGGTVYTLTHYDRDVARLVPLTDAFGEDGAWVVDTEQLEKTPDIGLDGERLDFSAKTLDEMRP